jgi:hemin uptake protein HemP
MPSQGRNPAWGTAMKDEGRLRDQPADPPAPGAHPGDPIRTEELFGKASVILIEHDGQIYLLRKTRHGKLILTK